MTFENHAEKTSTQSQQGHGAIAQQAWGPEAAKNQKPAARGSDAEQVINNGLALVGGLYSSFVHAAENNSTVKAVAHLAKSVENKIEENGKEAIHNPSGYMLKQTLLNPLQRAVGTAQGIFNFEVELSDSISHPVESVQKAAAPIVAAGAFAIGVDQHMRTFDFNGLGNDLKQAGTFGEKAVNGVISSLDYAVNASPNEQGEIVGHYGIPAVVSSLAGAKVFSAVKEFGTLETVGEGAGAEGGVLQTSKSLVGKAVAKSEEIEDKVGKAVFGEHHAKVKDLHEKVSQVTEPTQSVMEGSAKTYENNQVAREVGGVGAVAGRSIVKATEQAHLPSFEIMDSAA